MKDGIADRVGRKLGIEVGLGVGLKTTSAITPFGINPHRSNRCDRSLNWVNRLSTAIDEFLSIGTLCIATLVRTSSRLWRVLAVCVQVHPVNELRSLPPQLFATDDVKCAIVEAD